MTGDDFAKKMNEVWEKLKEFPSKLPDIVKGEGLQFIADNFKKQGFENAPGQVQKWQDRKEPRDKKKKKRNNRSLLVDSGQLKRSWDKETHSGATDVTFMSSRPYAEVHNDGGRAGRGGGFTMPARQMIGDSKALQQRIEEKIDREVEKLLN